jgi:hypothetical protein
MLTPSTFALHCALVVSVLAPFVGLAREGLLGDPPAHVVSSRGTRGGVAESRVDWEYRVPVGSVPFGTTLLARRALATPVATTTCPLPTPTTPTPLPDLDDSPLLGPTPTPAPDPDAVVDPLLETMTAAAAANLQACWNAAAWDSVTAILTPRFLQTALGISTPETTEQASAMAVLDLGPLHIETIDPVGIWSDGRGAVDVLYVRGRGDPVQAVAARWFLIAERGVVRFDDEVLLPVPSLGDRVTVGFDIADDQRPMQWNAPAGGRIPRSPVTALHGANRGWKPHTFLLEGASGETLGILTLPSWSQSDLVLLDLPAGSYRLHDPAVAGSELMLMVTG